MNSRAPASCLVVDDHQNARKWMCDSLREAFDGIEICTASNLRQASSQIHRSFDLALIDIGLPDGSGIDLISPLVDQGCQVVIASIFGSDEHLFRALQLGAKGYVLKDDPRSELIEMLLGILDGRPPLSPSIAQRLLDHFSTHQPADGDIDPEVDRLTEREREVLRLLAQGHTVRNVAESLSISYNTAAGYAKQVYAKLKVNSRAEATLEASRRGYLT